MLKYAALALVAVAGATPAMAQDSTAFDGFNVNVIAGWDHAKFGGVNDDGIAFGVGVGYDVNTGGAILGVELEAAESSLNYFGLSAKRDLYAGVRIGVELAPTWMLYVKGGYSNARLGCGSGCGFNLDGVRAGLGVEHELGENLYMKAEYRYTNYQFGFQRHQAVLGVGYRF